MGIGLLALRLFVFTDLPFVAWDWNRAGLRFLLRYVSTGLTVRAGDGEAVRCEK
jgi:hypothetical protein